MGVTQIGASYSEVPPGKAGCPCHVHHVEDEMFVILEGEGTYRFGSESYPVMAGDVLGAPRGGIEYAHKLTNTGKGPLKYLSISTRSDIEVCEYPDSNKFMVSSLVGVSHLWTIGMVRNLRSEFGPLLNLLGIHWQIACGGDV